MENQTDFIVTLVTASAIVFLLLVLIIVLAAISRKRLLIKDLEYSVKLKDQELDFQKKLVEATTDKTQSFVITCNRKKVKLNSQDVLFVRALGNYIELNTLNGRVVTRGKISGFMGLVPDKENYLRIHRSYIVRMDKVSAKTKDAVFIGEHRIKVGQVYRHLLKKGVLVKD